MSKRVFKKVSTPFESFKPTAAVLVVNMVDPQVSTMKVFLDAIGDAKLLFFAVANKMDLVTRKKFLDVKKELQLELISASMAESFGLKKITAQINKKFKGGDRIVVLGVFNSGKTSLISRLTGLDLAISDLPGTTLELAVPQIEQVVEILKKQVKSGHKIVTTGVGASALVAITADASVSFVLPEKVATKRMGIK